MKNFISNIEILNFKSIRHCSLTDCKRINLFIGRPNVGKSNILEALSMFTLPYMGPKAKLSSLVRAKNPTELYFNGDLDQVPAFRSQIGDWDLKFNPKEGLEIQLHYSDLAQSSFRVNKLGNELIIENARSNFSEDLPIKKYNFRPNIQFRKSHSKFLVPPFGQNLLGILENFTALRKEVEDLFMEYNLQLVFDVSNQTLQILQKGKINNNSIFLIPYSSIADTLQRVIFYKAAIASNDNSVIILEEPEAHSFPPYMSHITQEMIHKKDNQYFVSTHSPYILNDLLENGMDELAVFMVSYKKNETVTRQLSREELHEIYQNGVDLFTNSESYV
ncbi:MAG: AAA family ATPase [Chitinophagaceae bacterium]|nr:AAA family ATPase [Chitinophagaceae bacterium]